MSSRSDVVAELKNGFPELGFLPTGVFVVGGAVRDTLLGSKPLDLDLVCHSASAVANDFAGRIKGTLVELGQQRFATWRVVVQGRIYDFNEITGDSIEEDARRRDFTIDALAVEIDNGRLIDPTGGVQDLERRLLRMVREENFRDDPLRVLKGVRMAVELDFTIDRATMEAMQKYARFVSTVAAERVSYELDRLFSSSDRSRGLVLLSDLELDQALFGFGVDPDLIEAVALIGGNDPIVGYATLFFEHRDLIEKFVERWRKSERDRRAMMSALELSDAVRRAQRPDLPILIYDYGLDTSRRAVQLLYAFEFDREADALAEVIEARGESIAATTPLISGDRILAEAGLQAGPKVGRLKRAVLEAQLKGEIRTVEEAVALMKNLARL